MRFGSNILRTALKREQLTSKAASAMRALKAADKIFGALGFSLELVSSSVDANDERSSSDKLKGSAPNPNEAQL